MVSTFFIHWRAEQKRLLLEERKLLREILKSRKFQRVKAIRERLADLSFLLGENRTLLDRQMGGFKD